MESSIELPGNGAPEAGQAGESSLSTGMREFLSRHQGERHIIVLQNYPDPDALSSALAYQIIAAHCSIQADMVYSGRISHQQNIALVKLIGLNLIPFNPSLNLGVYQGAVFVDNQGTTSPAIVEALAAAGVPPLLIVDHHELQALLQAEMSDIRKVGATATIFTEYIQDGLLHLEKGQKEHVQLATALLHGIMTDTGDFIRATNPDFCAASYLSKYRDAELLMQIVNQARSRKAMDIIHKALVNRQIVENFSVAGLGYLRNEDRDVIPQAADFLLTEENVHTVISYGVVIVDEEDEILVGSLRTAKITLDPDEFIKDLFGKDAKGNYYGGGKAAAGGFQIPIGFLAGGESAPYRELKWKVYDRQIKSKVFAKIGVDHSN